MAAIARHVLAYKEDVTSDRRRSQNVPRHILFFSTGNFGGIKIKKENSVESEVMPRMMCSIEELGSDRNMYPEALGIWNLFLMMTQLSEKVQ